MQTLMINRWGPPFLLVLAVALGGCSYGSGRPVTLSELTRDRGWLLVEDMRLIRQSQHSDCGAAALAMMLTFWSVPHSMEEILSTIPNTPDRGMELGELRDFAKKKGLAAFVIKGEMTDLVSEVGKNRPVLVGLVQRQGDKDVSHYEVVAGINPKAHQVFLLDPAKGLREDSYRGFLFEWEKAGRPTLVIVPS